jgi:CheY-like chemotaxis protein
VRIRAAEQRCGAQRAWIVALTANAADEERRECFAAGMNDFVTKPFHPEAMRGVLRRYEARQHGGDAPSRQGGDGAPQRTDSWSRTAAVVLAARNSSRTNSLDMSVEVRECDAGSCEASPREAPGAPTAAAQSELVL